MVFLDWLSIYIGSSSIVIALLSVFVSLQKAQQMQKYKLYWVTALAFFAITGFVALIWQQMLIRTDTKNKATLDSLREIAHQARENKRDQEIAFSKGQLTAVVTLLSKNNNGNNANILSDLTHSFEQFSKRVNNANKEILPKIPLKKRALDLAKEILNFYSVRRRDAPPFTRPTTNGLTESQVWENQTVALYIQNFRLRVIEMHHELALLGYTNPFFDENCKFTANSLMIEETADEMAFLANRIQ